MNIKKNPEFRPAPGFPRAAPFGFPYRGPTVAEMDRQLDRLAWGVTLTPEERRRRRAEACRRTHKPNAGRPIKWRECPPEKLEDYRTLRKFYTAAEARAMLEAV